MKHVFDTDRIAHLWMHQTQDDARNPDNNFYFDHDTIYSYGRHFPIARHVVNSKGDKAILLTSRGYSVTTSKHINMVSRAIPRDAIVLKVPEVSLAPSQIIDKFADHIRDGLADIIGPTGRVRPRNWDALEGLIVRANAFAQFYGIRRHWDMPESTDAVKTTLAKERAKQARATKLAERKLAKLHAQRLAEALDLLERWKNGANIDTYILGRDAPVALRIVGDVVETSKGVDFPVEHAKRGIAFVRSVLGKGYKRNGHTFYLGVYAIDEIQPDGTVRAGCHIVPYAEVERIASLLGVSA